MWIYTISSLQLKDVHDLRKTNVLLCLNLKKLYKTSKIYKDYRKSKPLQKNRTLQEIHALAIDHSFLYLMLCSLTKQNWKLKSTIKSNLTLSKLCNIIGTCIANFTSNIFIPFRFLNKNYLTLTKMGNIYQHGVSVPNQ